MILYTSDSHLSHTNIIRYAKRPYVGVKEMDADIVAKLREAERRCTTLVHAGDLCFNYAFFVKTYGSIFADRRGKVFVAGNHDRMRGDKKLAPYEQDFDTITGTEKTWEVHGSVIEDVLDGQSVSVLVSHKPQTVLWGADVNVFGHVHNNLLFPGEGHHPEDNWAIESAIHFCACVELHDFRPRSLQDIAGAARAGYPLAAPAVARHYELHPTVSQ